MKIAPSVLTADFTILEKEIKSINEADYIHIDIMDGNFVPNISFGPAITKQIAALTRVNLDVHLMVQNPSEWIEKFSLESVEFITVHYEANDFVKAIKLIREKGKKIGLSINPKTSIESIKPYLEDVDLVLVMSVEPGFGGQKFMTSSLDKVEHLNSLRKLNNYRYVIEIDGGMNNETLVMAKNAGVDVAVVGSFLFNQKDRNEFMRKSR
ncbi:MAG: ribulose-phosphate 3-epimerase [Acholeplasma sp.]|nr:ribulose-phosphate 3-epimerase [Acholeplasma sp.]